MEEDSDENETSDIPMLHGLELSDRERYSIGEIIAQWGALEFEIFSQTVLTFEEGEEIPKKMNSTSFSKILEIWKERVVDKAKDPTKDKLQKEYDRIRHYYNFRNALAHGMWDWDKSSPDKIKTIRVRNKKIITTHFTASDLGELAFELAKINFNIRYPRGDEDLVEKIRETGGYIGRASMSMFMGNPVAKELLPILAELEEIK